MKVIKNSITISELEKMAQNIHGNLVKVIIDIKKRIMAVDADLHSDLFEFMIKEENSEPQNLWGINLYPDKEESDFIEFDSMMNLRPSLGNRTRGIESEELRDKIISIIKGLVKK